MFGDAKPEATALTQLAFHTDLPMMLVDYGLTNSQPEPAAAQPSAVLGFDLLKLAEYSHQPFGWNSPSLVFNCNNHVLVGGRCHNFDF